jgi:hypothetical protein
VTITLLVLVNVVECFVNIKMKSAYDMDIIGTEEAETVEEEEAGPSGMEAEDEGRILAVTIHRTDKLKNDFYIMHPMVRVHIVDELTGKYLPKQHKYV